MKGEVVRSKQNDLFVNGYELFHSSSLRSCVLRNIFRLSYSVSKAERWRETGWRFPPSTLRQSLGPHCSRSGHTCTASSLMVCCLEISTFRHLFNMVKSKKQSPIPHSCWPEAAPSPNEEKIISMSVGNSHISWAVHESVAQGLVPTLFWR